MALDKIIVENFKAFKGEHIFDLRQLNIFTGANNSGKSTLIKAISLFSKGLEKGDFPSIDLFEIDSGSFKDLVNWDSGADNFRIGFFIEVGEKKIPYKVMYEFVEGDTSKIEFSNFAICTNENELFLAFHNPKHFKVTVDNFEMIIPDGEEDNFEDIKHNFDRPFLSPSLDGDPSLAYSQINIKELDLFINKITEDDYSDLLDHLNNLSIKKQYWWSEMFCEGEFINLEKARISDLLSEFTLDYFTNLTDYDTKGSLYWSKNHHADYGLLIGYSYNKENIEVWRKSDYKYEKGKYDDLKAKLKYNLFISDVIEPIFNEIEKSLEFLKGDNVIHYKYSETEPNVILESSNSHLLSFFANKSDHFQSSKDMLSFFDIDGYIEVKLISNKLIKTNLVTGLKEVDKEIKLLEEEESKKLDDESIEKDYPKIIQDIMSRGDFNKIYKNNPRIEINELGRGLSSIIKLILSLLSIRINVSEKRLKYAEYEKQDIPKLIIIEEPEVFLHPNWQSKIIELIMYFFEDCNAKRFKIKPTIIIETHSVFLIQRLQILIGEKKLDKENVQVLYFNNEEEKEKYYEMRLREDGIFIDKFGEGFYDEIAKNSLKILGLERKN